ncbi:hypothetical protein GCM10027570_29600 [Streptomonospora sediminis]
MPPISFRAGAAAGRFAGETSFMLLRGHRGGPPHDLNAAPGEETHVEGDPRDAVLDDDAGPVLALTVPGWRLGMRVYEPGGDRYVWLSATDGARRGRACTATAAWNRADRAGCGTNCSRPAIGGRRTGAPPSPLSG